MPVTLLLKPLQAAARACARPRRVVPCGATGTVPTRTNALITVMAVAIYANPLLGAARSQEARMSDQTDESARERPCGPPLSTEVEQRLRARREIPGDEPIDITVGDLRFRVPHAYLAVRPALHTVGCRNRWKYFGFSFWWPDLRPTEADAFLFGGFRPKELGRPDTDTTASVVNVRLVMNVSERHNADYITPIQRRDNGTKYLELTFAGSEEFGLVKQVSSTPNYPFVFYGRYGEEEPNIRLRCDAQRTALYQICSGDIYYNSEDLAFFLSFLIEDLPRWKQIIGSAHGLLRAWQVELDTTKMKK